MVLGTLDLRRGFKVGGSIINKVMLVLAMFLRKSAERSFFVDQGGGRVIRGSLHIFTGSSKELEAFIFDP